MSLLGRSKNVRQNAIPRKLDRKAGHDEAAQNDEARQDRIKESMASLKKFWHASI